MIDENRNIKAILGPTNTGKTHYALEQLLSYKNGMIGFPLRLLAREAYDRVVEQTSVADVALITGEEKIIPDQARYFLCTTESMPISRSFDFVGVDEIQLCSDPERGHTFTNRLLYARGSEATLFMGSDAMTDIIKRVIPNIDIIEKPRLSDLKYKGFKKLTRLPARSAVVAFSVDEVYAIAEILRRQKGGTAIVLGALSPRTRNAQVELYQSGEVDYLVATDAIGMGLNLDIKHVAFAALKKFDGKKNRPLKNLEIGQIAGRAGRYKTDGSFGLTAGAKDLSPEQVQNLQNHKFEPITKLYWRNDDLNFNSLKELASSLDRPSTDETLLKGRPATDYMTLKKMMGDFEIMSAVKTPDLVRLLWDVCQIPDFRNILNEEHVRFIKRVFNDLKSDLNDGLGKINQDWFEQSIKRLNRTDGDIDTLMSRISHIRTWCYIAHRPHWLKDTKQSQEQTKAIEDMLSDMLHQRLSAKFVNKQSALILKNIGANDGIQATIEETGEVFIGTTPIGMASGFGFKNYDVSYEEDRAAIFKIVRPALMPYFDAKIETIKNDLETLKLNPDGTVFYKTERIARLIKGQDFFAPQIKLFQRDLLNREQIDKLERLLGDWVTDYIQTTLNNLLRLQNSENEITLKSRPKQNTQEQNKDGQKEEEQKDKTPTEQVLKISGAVRGILYQIYENFGWVQRKDIKDFTGELSLEDKRVLKAHDIYLGAFSLYLKDSLRRPQQTLMSILWNSYNTPTRHSLPDGGHITVPVKDNGHDNFLSRVGFYPIANRAIRLDMLERLNSKLYDTAEKGVTTLQPEHVNMIGLDYDSAQKLVRRMGFVTKSKDDKTFWLPSNKSKNDTSTNDNDAQTAQKSGHKKSTNKKSKKSNSKNKDSFTNSPFAALAALKEQKK